MSDHTEAPSVVNRYALVIQPTAFFLEWLRSTPDSDDLGEKDFEFEHTVYLVPEIEGEPEFIAQKHYRTIFEQELMAWYEDESYWPEERSWENFQRFFEVSFGSVVHDLGGQPIELES